MVTFRADTCDKCKNASPVSFRVEPDSAWKAVVLNRWRRLCPGCFDVEAEKARVRYSFADRAGSDRGKRVYADLAAATRNRWASAVTRSWILPPRPDLEGRALMWRAE